MPKVKRIRIRVRGRVVRGNGKGRPRMYYRMGEIRAAVDCANERSTRGLSQAKFSKVVGIAQPVISACETGKRDLSEKQVDVIRRAMSRFDEDLAAGRVQL